MEWFSSLRIMISSDSLISKFCFMEETKRSYLKGIFVILVAFINVFSFFQNERLIVIGFKCGSRRRSPVRVIVYSFPGDPNTSYSNCFPFSVKDKLFLMGFP